MRSSAVMIIITKRRSLKIIINGSFESPQQKNFHDNAKQMITYQTSIKLPSNRNVSKTFSPKLFCICAITFLERFQNNAETDW